MNLCCYSIICRYATCGYTHYIQISSHYCSRLMQVYPTQTLTITEHDISNFWVQLSGGVHFCRPTETGILAISSSFNFKIFFSLQYRQDFSSLLKQIRIKLISLSSSFPEVHGLDTLIKSTKGCLAYNLQNSLTMPFHDPNLESFDAIGSGT